MPFKSWVFVIPGPAIRASPLEMWDSAKIVALSLIHIYFLSSSRYSSILINQVFLRLRFRPFTISTKYGYCPTGPTGQMNTVCFPAFSLASISETISSAIARNT